MTAATLEAFRKVALAQLKATPSVASTLGQIKANDITVAYEQLLRALDDEIIEEKPVGMFDKPLFKAKPKKKKE